MSSQSFAKGPNARIRLPGRSSNGRGVLRDSNRLPLALAEAVRQKPLVEFGVAVSFGPGIMGGFGVNRQLDVVTADPFVGGHHLFGFFHFYDRVFGAVERPNGKFPELVPALAVGEKNRERFSAATDWGSSSKLFRMGRGETPCSITTHAQAGEVNAVGVNVVLQHNVVQQ